MRTRTCREGDGPSAAEEGGDRTDTVRSECTHDQTRQHQPINAMPLLNIHQAQPERHQLSPIAMARRDTPPRRHHSPLPLTSPNVRSHRSHAYGRALSCTVRSCFLCGGHGHDAKGGTAAPPTHPPRHTVDHPRVGRRFARGAGRQHKRGATGTCRNTEREGGAGGVRYASCRSLVPPRLARQAAAGERSRTRSSAQPGSG